MPKRSSKRKGDANELGFAVVRLATDRDAQGTRDANTDARRVGREATARNTAEGDIGETAQTPDQGKNPAAVALGRLGGLKGGQARAKSLSAKKRADIARKAARARWRRVSTKR